MKTLLNILLVTTVLYVGATQAAGISQGKAISLCKAEAQAQNENFSSSQLKRIRDSRSGYKVKLRVVLDDKTISSNCVIARDGSIEYSQS